VHQLQIDRYDHRVAIDDGAEHLLLRTRGTSLRLDVVAGTVLAGPVALELSFALDRLEWRIATVRALAAMLRDESPGAATDARMPRLVLALRALDARHEGASLRDIARGIFGAMDWPGDGDHIKSRTRRLVRLSDDLRRAGPRGVLGHRI
jgi:hypothetical protein